MVRIEADRCCEALAGKKPLKRLAEIYGHDKSNSVQKHQQRKSSKGCLVCCTEHVQGKENLMHNVKAVRMLPTDQVLGDPNGATPTSTTYGRDERLRSRWLLVSSAYSG